MLLRTPPGAPQGPGSAPHGGRQAHFRESHPQGRWGRGGDAGKVLMVRIWKETGAQRVSPPALTASRCGITAVGGEVALGWGPDLARRCSHHRLRALRFQGDGRGEASPPNYRAQPRAAGRARPLVAARGRVRAEGRPAPPRSPPSPRECHPAEPTKRSRPSLPPSSGRPESGALC